MKTTSKILQIINILFLILTFLFLVIQWNQIPIQIPTHYDIYGMIYTEQWIIMDKRPV